MTRPLRIGIDTLFENPDRPSGATGYLQTLLRWLPRVAPQHEFVAFVSGRNCGLWDGGPDLVRAWGGASNDRMAWRILSQQTTLPLAAMARRLDVLNAPGNVGPLLMPVPLVLTIKTLHHYHTPAALGAARTLYRRHMVEWSAARARLVIANCAATRDEIVRLVGVPASRVRIVYEAVHESFKPDPDVGAVRARVARRFGVAGRFVLFVSSLWRYKNPDGAIRAFAALPAQVREDTALVVVGQDYEGYRAELEVLARDLGVAGAVRFLGAVTNTDLPDLFRAAAVLLYPSHQETFGMPLVEAMRSGTPIVASTVPALREVAGDAATFVDPDDVQGMGAAITRVLEEPAVGAELRALGLRRGERFTGERMAADTVAVFEEAVVRRAS